jgi:hypothetical protein
MDHAFKYFLFKFIVVYQDDITGYSKKRSDHISHLRTTFDRCRKLGISLNPKKSFMGMFEAKLLGHIVSKGGVRIDPERASGIHEVPLPSTIKGIQSFLGRVNFVRRFTPNFAEIVKPITDTLKKGNDMVWREEAKQAFESIKQALSHSPTLASPDYACDFQIFSFASDQTIAYVLLQKNTDGHEQLIAYMSRSLQGSELKYKPMEKHAYAMVKGLAHFRPYFWNSHIVAYVPCPEVKDILAQKECSGNKGLWVTKIQEYDLEVKIAKIVKGQGLAALMTKKDLEPEVINQVNFISNDLQVSDWYRDIIFYLQNFSCPNFSKTQKRSLQLCVVKYCLWQGRLGWRSPHGLILRCVSLHETHQIMTELHAGVCGGHFSGRTTTHKIMRAGYYWSTLLRDTHIFICACEPC